MTGAKWNAQGPGVESQPLPLCREELSFHWGGGGDVGQRRLVPAQMDKEAASDLFSKHPSPPHQSLKACCPGGNQGSQGFLEKTNREACVLQEAEHSNLALLREGVPGTHCSSLPQVGMSQVQERRLTRRNKSATRSWTAPQVAAASAPPASSVAAPGLAGP